MPFAIVTDSTSDLRTHEYAELGVHRVPLYVNFRGETFQDWVEITPTELIEGIQDGADLPTTAQPTPEDFAAVYRDAVADGADEILTITLSSEMSGTYQSAGLAAKEAPVPVTVFDSLHASLGLGVMARRAAAMRDAGRSLEEVVEALGRIRDANYLIFTVASLEFLQKGGRIGRASALLGGLLSIRPLLTITDGVVAAAGRARGAKRAMKEMVSRLASYREKRPEGELVISFVHLQNEEGAAELRKAIADAGIAFRETGLYEMGSVIAVHVGPGTYGAYAFADATPELGL